MTPPDASARGRGRVALSVVLALVVVIGTLIVTVGAVTVSRTRPPRLSSETIAARAPWLAPGASVRPRDVDELTMFTMTRGLAVAVVAAGPWRWGHAYVVRTNDGARTWRVVARLPGGVQEGEFVSPLAAATSSTLYVGIATSRGAHEYVTTNGARRWRELAVTGDLQSTLLVDHHLWVDADRCRFTTAVSNPDSEICQGYLFIYGLGSRVAEGPGRMIAGATTTQVMTQLSGVEGERTLQVAVGGNAWAIEGWGQPGSSRFMLSVAGGAQWRQIVDPCNTTGAIPAGVFAPSANRWITYCTLGGGMSQGLNEIYVSSDQGQRWTLVAADNEDGSVHVGSFDDAMTTSLAVSHDGRDLWQATEVGLFLESHDGGVRWNQVPGAHNTNPSMFDTVGRSGAFIAEVGVGVWRTTNGVRWTRIT